MKNQEIDNCIDLLNNLANNPEEFVNIDKDRQIALMKAAGVISHPDIHTLKQRRKVIKRQKRESIVKVEREARAATGIRRAREDDVFTAPRLLTDENITERTDLVLNSPRNCYVCKAEYTQMHFFYDSMCPKCAELNYAKRFQTADLTGQVAVITGSRLKIGYQATVMMLRAGATVIATTRFPTDSAIRFAKEKDFGDWGYRLHIYGLDLRHTPSVELFCKHIEQTYERLDILINNAAQTVRRPPGFYAHMMDSERTPYEALSSNVQDLMRNHHNYSMQLSSVAAPNNDDMNQNPLPVSWNGKLPGIGIRESAQLSQIPYGYDDTLSTEKIFPKGKLDVDLQQVDLRTTNSWRLKLGEINTSEMLEVQLVNAIAPFVLCNMLAPMMKRDNTGKKHIINVTAMEGKFKRFKKEARHPHTNMAKAALNMLTHTSSREFADFGIFMNAVDTGWVTDEDPAQLSKIKTELHDFQPPLDIVDGAARVMDPLFDGINSGKHWCGKFLKDYFPIDW